MLMVESAEHLLSRLKSLDVMELREQWLIHFHSEAGTNLSAKLLRLAIAHRVQELEQDVTARCDAIRRLARSEAGAKGPTGHGYAQHMTPGTRLLREYKGKVHEVLAVQNGLFVHEGQSHKSLSEVARKITGKPRSGTRFFGLKGRMWRVFRD